MKDLDKIIALAKNPKNAGSGYLTYGTDEKFYTSVCFADMRNQGNEVNFSKIITIILNTTLSKDFIITYTEYLFHRLWDVSIGNIGETNKFLVALELRDKNSEIFLKERPSLNFYNLVILRLLGHEFCPKNGDIKPRKDSRDIFVDYNIKVLSERPFIGGNGNHYLDDDLWSFVQVLKNKSSSDQDFYSNLEQSETVSGYLEKIQNIIALGKPYANFFKKNSNLMRNTAITKGLAKEYESVQGKFI